MVKKNYYHNNYPPKDYYYYYYCGLAINHDGDCETSYYFSHFLDSALSVSKSPYFLDVLMVKINL